LSTSAHCPFACKGESLDCAFRIDVIIEHTVLLEIKSVERTLDIHKAQVITCLKLSGLPVGLLINFHVPVLRSGIRRLVSGAAMDLSREAS